jgi:hypothetical protein
LHPARVLNTASLRGSLGNNLNVNSKFYRAARVNVEIGNLPAPLNGNITTGGGDFGIVTAGNWIDVKPGTTLSVTGTNRINLEINRLCD